MFADTGIYITEKALRLGLFGCFLFDRILITECLALSTIVYSTEKTARAPCVCSSLSRVSGRAGGAAERFLLKTPRSPLAGIL